jgi:hypothetical protein
MSLKRVLIRPGKSIVVSDEVLSRARMGLQAFGTSAEALARLGGFKGDITIGASTGKAKSLRSITVATQRVAAAKVGR